MAADPRKLSIYLPDEIRGPAQQFCRDNRRGLSWLVREALAGYLRDNGIADVVNVDHRFKEPPSVDGQDQPA